MKHSWSICALCAVLVGIFGTSQYAQAFDLPARASSADYVFTPDKDFQAAVVMDVNTKKILFEYQKDRKWTAASLTKLVGALVFMDTQPAWDAIVAIKEIDEVGGGRLRVDDGSTMSIEDLMYSSITGSANNAATAFARLSGLGLAGFVQAMNAKARSLGCNDSIFTDPSGMDVGNTITATDLLKIATAAFNRERIQKPASTSEYKFTIRNTGEEKIIKNTNDLLLKPDNGLYVTGGKTGFLYESLHNLVYRVRPNRDGADRELMIVVLGAPSRADLFAHAEKLAKWTWSSYTWDAAQASALPVIAPQTASPAEPAVPSPQVLGMEDIKPDFPNGTLIKTAESPAVWYLWNNKKYILLDGVFLDLYFRGTPIQTVSTSVAESMPHVRPYTFDDGALLKYKGEPAVYVVYSGSLHPIVSGEVFESLGFSWNDIHEAPKFLLDQYTKGWLVTSGNSYVIAQAMSD
ncbi:MAG: D-alanyl-D-alanine carboxypeptidase family protein [Patescibacteria group bacterium]